MRIVIAAVIVGMLASLGCHTENTQADNDAIRKEFSQENYEKNMKAMGMGAELEAEKARQAKYQEGGGQGG